MKGWEFLFSRRAQVEAELFNKVLGVVAVVPTFQFACSVNGEDFQAAYEAAQAALNAETTNPGAYRLLFVKQI